MVWGPVYALVPTLTLCGVVLGVSHLMNHRHFRQRLGAGDVLEVAFGEDYLVLRGRWTTTTMSFDGIASLRTSGPRSCSLPSWGGRGRDLVEDPHGARNAAAAPYLFDEVLQRGECDVLRQRAVGDTGDTELLLASE